LIANSGKWRLAILVQRTAMGIDPAAIQFRCEWAIETTQRTNNEYVGPRHKQINGIDTLNRHIEQNQGWQWIAWWPQSYAQIEGK
jgi:low affinity Fe/Cu permease